MSGATRRKPQSTSLLPLVDLGIALGLVLCVLAVYSQVTSFRFIAYDDDLYVYNNLQVQAGLTLANMKWALTAIVAANWMPVTLYSHMLDCQLFSTASGMHHLTSVLLHAASTVLLFISLRRSTGSQVLSGLVAFIFALHPLHVQSVTWIAERKDVLSGFFFFLALYLYVRYTERPDLGRYLLMAAAFALGLMSKPMLVTFPFILLLFDFWPLRRFEWPKVLWEKLPLLALSAGASIVTYQIQNSTGVVQHFSLITRTENALLSYVIYIGQMIWPVRLAAIYPYPKSIGAWQAMAAGALLAAISALAVYTWRTRPYFAMGWFWYVGTLIPVIGLVQVGGQAHADRYTYLPMIGLTIALAWGAADAIQRWPRWKPAIAAVAMIFCAAWTAMAWTEISYWHDSETIFGRALEVTEDNWVAQYNLGYFLMKAPGRMADAVPHFEAAVRIKPNAESNNNLAYSLLNTGHPAEAVPYYEAVLRLTPEVADAHSNLGLALSRIPGRDADAIPHYQAALRIEPNNVEISNNLGACLLNSGRAAEAIPYFEAAVRMKPDSADAHFNLALAFSKTPGRASDAIAQDEAALRLNPNYAAAHHSLGVLLANQGRNADAVAHLETAVRLNPAYLSEDVSKTLTRLRAAR